MWGKWYGSFDGVGGFEGRPRISRIRTDEGVTMIKGIKADKSVWGCDVVSCETTSGRVASGQLSSTARVGDDSVLGRVWDGVWTAQSLKGCKV